MKRLLALLPVLLAIACSTATRQPASSQPEEAPHVESLMDQKRALQCDAGKEHWRSSGTPKRGGAFRFPENSSNLDITAPGAGGRNLSPQIYQFLVKPRACYYEDTAMEPDLAKSWQVSSDGLNWTIKLRDDARWHNKSPVNGRPFTSADVAWTIDYQKQGAGLRSYWEFVDHQEPDAATVVLKMREPDADFLGKLGYDSNVIVPREVKEQLGDFKTAAIGTGAFMLKEYRAADRVIMERNPDYPEKGVDGKALPYLDEIQVLQIADYTAQLAAFRAGQLEMNASSGGFMKSDMDELRKANPKLTYYRDIVGANWGLWFNLERKPFDDPRVRRALSIAMDREEIVARNEGSAVYCGFVPCGILDYAWPADKAREKFRHAPEETKRLMVEAGQAGKRFSLRVSPGLNQLDAEVVQQELRAAGVETEMIVEAAVAPIGVVLARGDSDLVYGGPTTSFLLDYWLGSVVRTGGAQNFLKFSDQRVDALSAAQAKELDPAKRKLVADQLQDVLYDLMPYAPTINRIYHRVYACAVKNMRPTHQSRNLEGLDRAWLDSAGC
jgi:peptide/nickel transport system substrate-binding protein